MNTVLHIGTEKTGTKSIQVFLAMNRRRLRDRGIVFTKSLGAENNRDLATYAIRDTEFNDDALSALGIKDRQSRSAYRSGVDERLKSELRDIPAHSRFVIFSSEHLQSRLKSPAEIETLKSLLARHGLQVARVIVYLREPADIIWSLYSTALRNGTTDPPPATPERPHWNHICDHQHTLSIWADAFGRDVVVPRLFTFGRESGQDLIKDFAATAGVDMNDLAVPLLQNRALTSTGQTLLRGINTRLSLADTDLDLPARLRMVQAVSDRFSGTPAQVPSTLRVACERRFADSNEWVRRRYFPQLVQLFGVAPDADRGVTTAPTVDDALDAFADYWQSERRAHLHDHT